MEGKRMNKRGKYQKRGFRGEKSSREMHKVFIQYNMRKIVPHLINIFPEIIFLKNSCFRS